MSSRSDQPDEGGRAAGTWVRDPAVLWRRTGDQVLLKTADGSEIVALGSIGLELWEELAIPVSIEGVAHRMGARYGVPAQRVAEELAPVLDDLERKRLVSRSP